MLFRKDRPLMVPVILALSVVLVSVLLYRFVNFREERVVKRFLQEVKFGNYPKAYEIWGSSAAYTYQDFMSDWGENGYYGRVNSYRVLDSQTRGTGVIVYVEINDLKTPMAFWVERRTRTIGFSPIYEYRP